MFKQTSHAERLVQKSDTPSAQEEPTQQQSAVQVSNASELRTPSALNLELQISVESRAPSATELRAPIVPESENPLRRSKRDLGTLSLLGEAFEN